jgi:hypothetical protein
MLAYYFFDCTSHFTVLGGCLCILHHEAVHCVANLIRALSCFHSPQNISLFTRTVSSQDARSVTKAKHRTANKATITKAGHPKILDALLPFRHVIRAGI